MIDHRTSGKRFEKKKRTEREYRFPNNTEILYFNKNYQFNQLQYQSSSP